VERAGRSSNPQTPRSSKSRDVEVPAFAQRVLDLVDSIPRGKVLAYGDIAEYLGEGGPRQVGTVMSTWGGGVAWHRVVHADGTPAPSHDGKVLRLLRADVTPMRGDRVDMKRARWDVDR
jgi:alkylated DNA nucleotide flippase Atl1